MLLALALVSVGALRVERRVVAPRARLMAQQMPEAEVSQLCGTIRKFKRSAAAAIFRLCLARVGMCVSGRVESNELDPRARSGRVTRGGARPFFFFFSQARSEIERRNEEGDAVAGLAAAAAPGAAAIAAATRRAPTPLGFAPLLAEKALQLVDDALSLAAEPRAARAVERVVVLGSGWGAASFVSSIEDSAHVTVVSPRNYFLFTPMLAGAAVGTVEYREPSRRPFPASSPFLSTRKNINAARFAEAVSGAARVGRLGARCFRRSRARARASLKTRGGCCLFTRARRLHHAAGALAERKGGFGRRWHNLSATLREARSTRVRRERGATFGERGARESGRKTCLCPFMVVVVVVVVVVMVFDARLVPSGGLPGSDGDQDRYCA